MPIRFLLALCLLGATAAGAFAQSAQPDPAAAVAAPAPSRPKIALVLSGGGARGGAHIGVLKVLEELHVPIDMIVGASAGSIVGAAYATGMPLADIEKEMRTLSTALLFRDVVREAVPPQRKNDDALNYVGPEIGISAGGMSLPKGAVAGVALEAVLRRLTARQQDTHFDRLPIPFRAVATDLATSEMVVLDHGSLAQAVRASMAIPAVISPVELDGRLLVDGGVRRNLPVDVARSMGAEVIIAVNIGTPLLSKKEITSLLSASDQLLRILTATNVADSLRELTPRDVLITPELSDISSSDFDHLPEAARAGEQAANEAHAALARYQMPEQAYAGLIASRNAAQMPVGQRIDVVRVDGTKRVDPETIAETMQIRPGQKFDAAAADEDMRRLYGRGDFEAVSYTFANEPGEGYVLTASVTEKSWGPNYLRFGLGLSSDFQGNSFFNLLATQRSTWLNSLGGEWRNDLQIGHEDYLRTEWYQPLSASQRYFVAAYAQTGRQPIDLYNDASLRVASFRLGQSKFGADLGLQLGNAGEVRLGAEKGHASFHNDTSSVPVGELSNANAATGGVRLRLKIDTLDNLPFPQDGYLLNLDLFNSRPTFGATYSYNKLSASLRTAYSVGPHVFQFAVAGVGASGADPLPPHEASYLGGFQRLSGYKTGELAGDEYVLGRVVYNYRLAKAGFLDGAYAGVSLETGRIGENLSGSGRTQNRFGSSVYVAFDTPLGPMYLAYGRADGKRQALYFYLGQPW
ncbi:patatin-like phospholipase family protein [Variovorax sp. HJSM1_2]|uniref:patatin-like phospholipase family protein n=1 Tax=Variovorax sp. HJSM1_2 TaxID=3366263 RepID=UPI003BCD9BD9